MREQAFACIVLIGWVMLGASDTAAHDPEKKTRGKLGAFEEAITGEAAAKKHNDDDEVDSDDEDCCYEGGAVNDPLLHLLVDGLVDGLIGYPLNDAEAAELWPPESFSPYPYARGNGGRFSPGPGRRFSVDASAYYLHHNHDLHGFGSRLRASPHPAYSLEFQFTDFRERLEAGEDRLILYKLLFNYNRVRLSVLEVWWGAGLSGLHATHNIVGYAYDLGFEVYPMRPISFQFVHTGSFLNGRYVPEFLGTLNAHVGRGAVMAGYQSWAVGGVVLGGFVLGVKITL